MNKLSKTIDAKDLTFEFLKALNGILRLSDKKLLVLAKLVDINVSFSTNTNIIKNVISTDNRKIVAKECNITSENLSRFITEFKEKGYIVKGNADDEYNVNKALLPEIIRDRLQLTIVLKIGNK